MLERSFSNYHVKKLKNLLNHLMYQINLSKMPVLTIICFVMPIFMFTLHVVPS